MKSNISSFLLPVALVASLTACGDDGTTPQAAPPGFSHGRPPNAAPPKNPVGGFEIALPPLTVKPGEEDVPCWIFPLDLKGPSHIVAGGSLTVGYGMHHGNITTRPKTGEGMRKCPKDDPGIQGEALDIAKGGAVLFGSSTQIHGTEWQSFPDGMGYRIKDGFEIVARMHYLNTTAGDLTVEPKYQWYTIAEDSVVHELGPFAWANNAIDIPPRTDATVTGSCDFPPGMHIVELLPHMHKLGYEFDAAFIGGKFDGKEFLHSPGYDPDRGVLLEYDPPIDLSQGDGASFTCKWHNNTDHEVFEGIGNNEMCILFGYAYPPQNAFSALAWPTACFYVAPP